MELDQTRLAEVAARVRSIYGDVSDLPAELVNTLANIYWNALTRISDVRNKPTDLLRPMMEKVDSGKDFGDAFRETSQQQARLLGSLKHGPDLVRALRGIRREKPDLFSYVSEVTIDILKYGIENAESKSQDQRRRERVGRNVDEIPNLAVLIGLIKLSQGDVEKKEDAESHFLRGIDLAMGSGVRKDEAAALTWFRRAALQGHAQAQYALGSMYLGGRGVEQDVAVAMEWLRKSADQGLAQAQFDLGCMYGILQVAPADYVQAYKWLELASMGKATDAEKSRDLVGAKMTRAQILEAMGLVNAWLTSRLAAYEGDDPAGGGQHLSDSPAESSEAEDFNWMLAMPTAPNFMDATAIAVFRAPGYIISHFKNLVPISESVGIVSNFQVHYLQVLAVLSDGWARRPALFITLERGVGRSLFLCVFKRDGTRDNLGSGADYQTDQAFLDAAWQILERYLQVTRLQVRPAAERSSAPLVGSSAAPSRSGDSGSSSMVRVAEGPGPDRAPKSNGKCDEEQVVELLAHLGFAVEAVGTENVLLALDLASQIGLNAHEAALQIAWALTDGEPQKVALRQRLREESQLWIQDGLVRKEIFAILEGSSAAIERGVDASARIFGTAAGGSDREKPETKSGLYDSSLSTSVRTAGEREIYNEQVARLLPRLGFTLAEAGSQKVLNALDTTWQNGGTPHEAALYIAYAVFHGMLTAEEPRAAGVRQKIREESQRWIRDGLVRKALVDADERTADGWVQKADARARGSVRESPETKNDFIRSLVRNRVQKDPLMQGMGYDIGMVDSLDQSKIVGLPEATIAVIVETYSLLRRAGAAEHDTFERIEAFRAQHQPGTGPLPTPLTLDSYVAYRIEIEHGHARLSKKFIASAILACREYFGC